MPFRMPDIAYLLRYLVLVFVLIGTIQMLKLAISEYRWSLRHALRPARGYFLLALPGTAMSPKVRDREEKRRFHLRERLKEAAAAEIEDTFAAEAEAAFQKQDAFRHKLLEHQSLLTGSDFFQDFDRNPRQAFDSARRRADANMVAQLRAHEAEIARDQAEARERARAKTLAIYPTTVIGREASSDIRVYSRSMRKRHAVIYRYDGEWFIRPQSHRAELRINGQSVDRETALRNHDRIELPGLVFEFIDERQVAAEAGLDYAGAQVDDAYFLDALRVSTKMPFLAFLCFNLLSILCFGLITYYLPNEFLANQELLIGLFSAYLVLMDFYFLFLPKILRYGDRLLLLALGYLSTLGLALQARFCFYRNPWFVRETASGDPKRMAAAVKLLSNRFIVQVGAVLLGATLLFVIALLIKKTLLLEKLSMVCLIITPLFLLATKVLGHGMEDNGADLWIRVGPITIQLTEFAKISYAIVLATFFKNRPKLSTQVFFAIWAALVFFLIMLLPDLGSAMILLPTTLIVFIAMTSEFFKAALVLVASGAAGSLAYLLFPHVQRRISGWTSLWQEVNDQNAQIIYGLQGMARGGLLGRGIGNGNPWGIPLFNSDMVFAIVVEELGLIVGLCCVLFYATIWLRSARGALLARDGFSSSLILGLGTMTFMEAVVVIGGTTGLIPLTGATLPFIARGGSSILAKWIVLALLFGLLARQEAGANRQYLEAER